MSAQPQYDWRLVKMWADRSAALASQRTVTPNLHVSTDRGTLIDQFVAYVTPWHVFEYPGPYRLVAALCRVSPVGASLKRWRRDPDKMPAFQALRLAEYLEARVAGELRLIDDLREHARRHEAEKPLRYFARMPVDERRRLAAERRALRDAERLRSADIPG